MDFDLVRSPAAFLTACLGDVPGSAGLREYQSWWEGDGRATSEAIDRARTPWLRMFDAWGNRRDEIVLPPAYWQMIRKGYQAGVVWRALAEHSLLTPYLLGYVTSFFDPGLYCPYTVSLATALPLSKYGSDDLKTRFLRPMLREDGAGWQGATWMTEAGGGSDLGAGVETTARRLGERWLLWGDKHFASNAGADLAVVAARPQGAPAGVRGLALFVVPKLREDGRLNYFIRRLKDKIGTRSVPTAEVELRDSEAYLLDRPERGIYLILEVLNISRVANAVASVALAQRAIADALLFAERRRAFGKPIIEHPLLRHQFEARLAQLHDALALAWTSVRLLDRVWQQSHPYDDDYHLFRLVAHLAKYWTAEFAAQTAKWSMEVHGGAGVLEEFGVERWLREAMILAIWEGTPHRQVLDGLEVMERKRAHRLLFDYLAGSAEPAALERISAEVERHLSLGEADKEARADQLFSRLGAFTASALRARLRS